MYKRQRYNYVDRDIYSSSSGDQNQPMRRQPSGRASQNSREISSGRGRRRRKSGDVYKRQGLLHAALPAAIPIDDGRFEGHTLESGHMERDIAGGRGKVPVVVTAAVALSLIHI